MDFIVLSSSRGTVFQATIERILDGSLNARCLGLVTDQKDRGCVEKARNAGLPFKIVPIQKDELRENYDKRLNQTIEELIISSTKNLPNHKTTKPQNQKTIIACQGWLKILSPWFVRQWPNRILNVHPSLLPKHKGIRAHESVLEAKEKASGMTIHLVDEGVDTGKILLQKTCPVLPGDTVETLKERVQSLEMEWYPKALEMIERGELKMNNEQ